MTKYFTLILIGFLHNLLIITFLSANSNPRQLDSLIIQGKQQFYNLNVNNARKTFDLIKKEYPDYPHGYFYEAYLTLIGWSQDMTNDSLTTVLQQQVDQAIDIADKYKESYQDDNDANFHLGLCYGIKGIYQTVNRNYLKTYWYGRKAKGYLEDVVKADSTYYDAYLGLGIFLYYVDLMPGVVKFFAGILGFHGDREKGRNEIYLTSTNGRYFKEEAYFTYYIIKYFLEGDKQNAVIKLKKMGERYPANPAIKLMLAYHYRRSGDLKQCIKYCRAIPDSFLYTLPQIVDSKYYNLAVSHFTQNQFHKSDSLFDELIELPTRKSPYYQAAIRYYKGLLAKLNFDEQKAFRYHKYVISSRQTQYWYSLTQMYLKYSMDSLMYQQIYNRNLLYNRNYQNSLKKALELKARIKSLNNFENPNQPYLIVDLIAENYFFQRQFRLAKETYNEIIPYLDKMEDEFRKSWIYIHYAKCLRELGDYNTAEKMLNYAHKYDDDFTRLIISREKYLVNQLKERKKKV